MLTHQLQEFLESLKRELSCKSASVLCHHENLETVHIDIHAGRVRVSDGQDTFRYLAESGDSTYKPLEALDLEKIATTCERFGATLLQEDEDEYPHIEVLLDSGDSLENAINRVAEAVDAVFEFAAGRDAV